jgi:Fur family peroxide stress response transcriptional regulator
VTHQRTAIYTMLAATDSHPSPEEVYGAIRGALPSISLATVYKVLDLFQRHGFLRKVSTENQVARYDANTGTHHHLISRKCDRIEDVEVALPGGESPRPEGTEFEVDRCDIIFHGLCSQCRAEAAAASV